MVADMISFLKGETKTVENKLSKQMDYFTAKMIILAHFPIDAIDPYRKCLNLTHFL